jgi:MFS family permease
MVALRALRFLDFSANRWLSLIAGCTLATLAGTGYSFSIYAPQIKSRLDYTQEKIDSIGTIGYLGIATTGVITGYFYDIFGPRLAALLGASCLFGGYFLMWLSVSGFILNNYILLGFFFAIAGMGNRAAYTAALATNVKNFDHKHSGKVVGVLVALFGLSAAIFTQIYDLFFKPQVLHFLLFLSIALGGLTVICTPALGFTTETKNRLQQQKDDEAIKRAKGKEVPINYAPVEELEGQTETKPLVALKIARGTDLNPLQAALKLDFWLLVIIASIGIGTAQEVVTNLGSIVISLGEKDGTQDVLVIIFSVIDTISRASIGFLSDRLAKWIVRPVFLVLSLGLLGISQIIFAVGNYTWLFVGIILLGWAFGGIFSVVPTMTQDLWGTKYFGTNFSTVLLFPGFSSYLLASVMAGKIYDEFYGTNTQRKEKDRDWNGKSNLKKKNRHSPNFYEEALNPCFYDIYLICPNLLFLRWGVVRFAS